MKYPVCFKGTIENKYHNDEIKQLVVGSGIAGMQRVMNEKLEQWREVKVNLAVLGASGVGKSSFINAIRGYEFLLP